VRSFLVVLGKCLLIGWMPARCQVFQFLLAQHPGPFGSDRQTRSQQDKSNNPPFNYTLEIKLAIVTLMCSEYISEFVHEKSSHPVIYTNSATFMSLGV